MREPVRVIEESESGLVLIVEILIALVVIFIVTPVMFIVDLVRSRRRRGRHRV